jgi:hypothetical protein
MKQSSVVFAQIDLFADICPMNRFPLAVSLGIVLLAIATTAVGQTNTLVLDTETRNLIRDTASRLATLSTATNTMSVKLDEETRNALRPPIEEKWFKKEALMGTVIGGVIATVTGAFGSFYSHRLRAKHEKQQGEEFSSNVLRAIRRELEVLNQTYERGIGDKLKKVPAGEMFLHRLALTQDWFTIYNANAVHLGKLPADISRQIIATYALVKGLIEEFRINNGYVDQWEEITHGKIQGAANEPKHVADARRHMVQQADDIRNLESALRTSNAELFRLFDASAIK